MGRGHEFTFGHTGFEVLVRHLSGDVWNTIEDVSAELQREVQMGAVDTLWFLNIMDWICYGKTGLVNDWSFKQTNAKQNEEANFKWT